MRFNLVFIFFVLATLSLNGQVLLEINNNFKILQSSETYAQNKIKRISHTMEVPFLVSMEISPGKKVKAKPEWDKDTITYSKTYSKNGFIENEKETLPNGETFYLKEYFFDSAGNLMRIREINNHRLRYYDYQETIYTYFDNQVERMDKIRFKDGDTTKTTTHFFYSANKLEKVIERNNNNGDTLLSSYISYNTKKNYIEEKSFIKEWAEVRTTYYYILDDKGRLCKYTNGLNGFKRNLKSYEKISYDFSNEIFEQENLFFKIEKYDL